MVAIIFVLLVSIAHGTRAHAQPAPSVQNPQIDIAYVLPRNRSYHPIYNRLKDRKVLEELKQRQARRGRPRKRTGQMDQCAAASRPYEPQLPVTICYELVDQIEKVAAKMDASVRPSVIVGAFIEATLHEVAHALFDMLQ